MRCFCNAQTIFIFMFMHRYCLKFCFVNLKIIRISYIKHRNYCEPHYWGTFGSAKGRSVQRGPHNSGTQNKDGEIYLTWVRKYHFVVTFLSLWFALGFFVCRLEFHQSKCGPSQQFVAADHSIETQSTHTVQIESQTSHDYWLASRWDPGSFPHLVEIADNVSNELKKKLCSRVFQFAAPSPFIFVIP